MKVLIILVLFIAACGDGKTKTACQKLIDQREDLLRKMDPDRMLLNDVDRLINIHCQCECECVPDTIRQTVYILKRDNNDTVKLLNPQ